MRVGEAGSASGLVLYIILEFLICDSCIVGILFLLGHEQSSGDLNKLSNLLFVCDSLK